MNIFLKFALLFTGGGLINYVCHFVFHLPVVIGFILAFLYGWNFDWIIGER